MLNLKELYQIAQAGGTMLQSKNYVGALMKYVACMMKSCQEILQIKATADLINENGSNASASINELISDSDKVFELARQCLNQSDAIVHSFFGLPAATAQQSPQQCRRVAKVSRSQTTLSRSVLVMGPSSSSPSLSKSMSVIPPFTSPKGSVSEISTSPLTNSSQKPVPEAIPELMLLEGVSVSENNRRIISEMGPQKIELINEPALTLQYQLSTLRTKIEAAVNHERSLLQPNASKIFGLRSQFLRQNYELMNIATTQQNARVNQVLSEYYAIHKAQEEAAAAAEAEIQAARVATEKVRGMLMNMSSKYLRRIDNFSQELLKEQTGKVPNVRKLGESVRKYVYGFASEMITTTKATENEYDEIIDLCSDCVVERCYDTIYPMFMRKTELEDAKTNSRLKVLRNMITPDTVGANKKFWLVSPENEGADVVHVMESAYAETISAFSQISGTRSVNGKLRCLKTAMDSVPAAIEKFYGSITDDLVMGADDLLPILSFSLFKSGLINTHAEVEFISELMDDRKNMGESGYNVATFQACVGYVDTIKPQDL